MDKHERKRLRDNDQRLGRIHTEFEAMMREDKHIRDKRFLYEALRTYTPRSLLGLRFTVPNAYFRDVTVGDEQVNVWIWGDGHAFPRGGPYFWLWQEPLPVLERLKREVERPIHRIGDPTGYVWDPTGHRILIKESLKKFQHELDVENIRTHGPSFFRTIERTQLLLPDLRRGYARMQTILHCKRIKQDLMENVWHPRRVEHVLMTYGWEAYENLLAE